MTTKPSAVPLVDYDYSVEVLSTLMKEIAVLRKLKSLGFSANLSYALGFLSVIASIAIWFTMGGTGNEIDAAAGERFGIFVGLWAPTFMALGNGIDNLSDDK